MLNSRYIYLHEALGLGPMWLKQNARVHLDEIQRLPEKISPLVETLPQSAPITSNLQKKHSKKQAASSSRLQILQRIGSKNATSHEITSPNATLQNQQHFKQSEWQTSLSGSINPVKVMILSVCASPDDITSGRLYSGEDGILLNKMLSAIKLNEKDVYLNTWLKNLPDFTPNPSEETVRQNLPRIIAEWQESQAKALLLLGSHFFSRKDVQSHIQQITSPDRIFHLYHPQQILNNPMLKRPAWEVLQQLQTFLSQP